MFDLDELEEDLSATTRSVEGVLEAVSEDPPGALTTGQADAWKRVTTELSAGDMASLLGPAGTGKSFLITRLAERAAEEGLNVKCVAPTHQAVGVLSEEGGQSIDSGTIQSTLGLKLEKDGRGGMELRPTGEPDIEKRDLIIADEASMIGTELWEYVVASTRGNDVKWLLVGDPAQLPPVNEAPSPALDQPGARLENIVRQAAGNPIIELASRLREGGDFSPLPDPKTNGEAGIYTIRQYEAPEKIARAVDKNPEGARALAYRNKTVAKWGKRTKQILFPGEPAYHEGLHVLAKKPYAPDGRMEYHTSALLEVTDARKDHRQVGESGPKIPAWVLDLKNKSQGSSHAGVPVPREEGKRRFEDFKSRMARQQEWSEYYAAVEQWAWDDGPTLVPAYAQTCHSAQGATCDHIFLDVHDLKACHDPRERRALAYVGVTRAAKSLILIV